MIKAVLFDFDGVLTTEKTGSQSILRYLSERTGVCEDVLKKEYYKFNKSLLSGALTHNDIWVEFCKNVGMALDYSLLTCSFRNTPIDWSMISVLRKLKSKYKIGLITDNKKDRIDEVLSFYQFVDLFDIVSVSAEYHSGKDDRRIFDGTLAALGVRPQECVFIDNSEKNLIVPRELGIHTIHFDDDKRDIDLFLIDLYKVI